MIHQNLTQFCYDNSYPSEFDILEHGMLGESGHMSKRTKEHLMNAHVDRLNKHLEAVEIFCNKIMNDEIIDINGKYTKADLIKRKNKAYNNLILGEILQNERHIEHINSLGKMSHLDNGKLKKGYQRAVDFSIHKITELKDKLIQE